MVRVTQDFVAPVLPRLRAEVEELPAQARRVAHVLLGDPHGAARLSIAGLAARAATSEASVTRLAQRLGYAGFPDLRIALAAESAAGRDPVRITAGIGLDDDVASVKATVLASLQRSLEETVAVLDDAAVAAVADAVVGARRTLVVGVGASGAVAQDLARKLERVGLPSAALTDLHDAVTSCVAARPEDVVIGVSHSGETVDVVEPLLRAGATGARTVALTSRPSSVLARSCDHLLLCVAEGEDGLRPAAMSSRSAQLLVVDVVFVAVLQRDHERAAPLLEASYDATSPRHPDRAPRRGGAA